MSCANGGTSVAAAAREARLGAPRASRALRGRLAGSLELYAVTDRRWLSDGEALVDRVAKAIDGGATCVQLREKHLPREELLALAVEVGALCSARGVPFFVDDDVEAALLANADGVHVGQDDEDAAEVRRRIGPDKILGVSAQTVEQARAAEVAGADYLGVGAVFPTSTKTDAAEVPPETLRAICSAVSIPVVAIGGIGRDNLLELSGSGVAGVALVSAIFAADDAESACRELRGLTGRMLRGTGVSPCGDAYAADGRER